MLKIYATIFMGIFMTVGAVKAETKKTECYFDNATTLEVYENKANKETFKVAICELPDMSKYVEVYHPGSGEPGDWAYIGSKIDVIYEEKDSVVNEDTEEMEELVKYVCFNKGSHVYTENVLVLSVYPAQQKMEVAKKLWHEQNEFLTKIK